MEIFRGLPTSTFLHNRFPIFFAELPFLYYVLFWWENNSQHLLSKMEVKKAISSLFPFRFIDQGLIKESLSLVFES